MSHCTPIDGVHSNIWIVVTSSQRQLSLSCNKFFPPPMSDFVFSENIFSLATDWAIHITSLLVFAYPMAANCFRNTESPFSSSLSKQSRVNSMSDATTYLSFNVVFSISWTLAASFTPISPFLIASIAAIICTWVYCLHFCLFVGERKTTGANLDLFFLLRSSFILYEVALLS